MLHSDNYDKISLETYKEIYSEAKDKFIDTLNQSEIITGRAVQVVILISALAGWAATSFLGIHKNFYLFLFLYISLLILLCIITAQLFSKRVLPLKGTMPRSIYDTEEDLISQVYDRDKVFYYQQINRYQRKIDLVEKDNKKRSAKLGLALSLSFLLFLSTVLLFIYKTTQT